MTEMPWDAPVEDAAEQRVPVLPDPDDERGATVTTERRLPWDVDPGDVAAEDTEVPLDEDEWR